MSLPAEPGQGFDASAPEAPRESDGLSAIEIEKAFVRFFSSGECYAMALTSVREVVPAGSFSTVPRAPSCTVGLMNHGGRVYTIVDLSALLSSGPGRARDQVLLLDDPERPWGIAVDQVEGIGPLEVNEDIGRFGDRAVAVVRLQGLAERIDAAFESASMLVLPRPASSPKES